MRTFIAFFLLFCLVGCSEDVTPIVYHTSEDLAVVKKANNSEGIEIYCPGSCSNFAPGPASYCPMSGVGKSWECACAGCSMIIEYLQDGSSTNDELGEYTHAFDLETARDRISLKTNADISDVNIIRVGLNEGNGITTTLFTYTLGESDDTFTILYAGDGDEGSLIDGTIEIDCTGTCECKEEFNSTTGKASCSCDECTMTVTRVDK